MASTGLEAELRSKIRGDVLFDDVSRLIFSTDASLYQIKPLGVVFPRDREDLARVVATAARHGVPLLPRGGGTSLAGQAVSPGLVVDCSKYLNKVLEINPKNRWARVEPGVVLDNLNDFLRFYGLFFAPDVATASRATIGGMIGNNSAGARSIRYGKTVDHIIGVKILLSTGEELALDRLDLAGLKAKCARQDREGELYRTVRAVVADNRAEITVRYPKVMRRVGGYNLDCLVDEDNFNLAQLVVGSEGTLGLVTEARLNLEPIPAAKALFVVFFRTFIDAVESVEPILRHGPSAVEILDPKSIRLAKSNPTVERLFATFSRGNPESLLIVELQGRSEEAVRTAAAGLTGDPAVRRLGYHIHEAWDEAGQALVWQVRKHTLGVLLSMRGDAKPVPFIEDACVPVEHLRAYVQAIQEVCQSHGREVILYAHASVGVIHVRPVLNLKRTEDVRIMASISGQAFALVKKYGGAWSGEHGDGLARSYKNPEFFGERLFTAFGSIKAAFDPAGIMNPGKVTATPDMTADLRIHPEYRTQAPPTHFRFERDHGLAGAIEMCSGLGHCRKTLGGTMCPSYMATRDEEHSTRGRANALRSAIAGDLGPDGFTSPRLHQVLDLCLECKACKTECPSNVDMARMKSEFLAHYHEAHGLPFGKKLFARARETAEKGSRFPSLFNFVAQTRLARAWLENHAGIDRRRHLPTLAPKPFSKLIPGLPTGSGQGERVLLFVDTFVNFFQPQIGLAALEVLRALGFDPEPVQADCCGRPLLSAGLLREVKERGARLLEVFSNKGTQDGPIIVLEPSCHSTFIDDYPDLLDDAEAARAFAKRVVTLDQFLSSPQVWERLASKLEKGPPDILLHSHCQQKALLGSGSTLRALKAVPETRVREVDSGCCGMAGSFGYEKSHYALSEKIGNRKLFPSIKKTESDTVIVASGFSCRTQIEQFTGRRAWHLAEALAFCLKG